MPTWGTPKKTRVSKVGSSVSSITRYATRITSALRSPRAASSLVISKILGAAGLSAFAFPIIAVLLPTIQSIIESYVEAEVKRKLEEEREKIVSEVIAALNDEDRALLRELVPG